MSLAKLLYFKFHIGCSEVSGFLAPQHYGRELRISSPEMGFGIKLQGVVFITGCGLCVDYFLNTY